ncbi:glycosyltransferase family 2 protein [Epibacterium sp. MM17-32]|uniref:glycosyltransferase family 2 protein n=1 Tax=Epibacterium sp. MM17-32 TaxID=2917734 RepID=UPI001EF6CF5C|nr:glycosyltransferase family 2 protein [Epibacterium sp. MM17-32]MCG7629828.1 glycosyltransferase family 2 protein [Epibacterium sp. MM17-32]
MSRVTLVTVAYNSAAVLPTLLASVPEDVDCVIVDNGSQDTDEVRHLAATHGAELVISEHNIGFGPGCNLGAAHGTGEFLFFVNPDATLSPGAVEALLAAADAHPEACAFNPRLREGNGKIAFKRRSKLLPKSLWLPREAAERDCDLPVLQGSAIFVRRAAFEAVGGFDPEIFLYHEDDDLSLRLRQTCGPLRLVTAAEVVHLFGESTVRSPRTAALKAWYMGQSRVYACRKHGMSSAFAVALRDAMMQLLSPLTLLSARKRAKHWAYLRGVWAARNAPGANQPFLTD